MPTLAFAGASVGITYDYRNAAYTRIGNLVFIAISIKLTSKGTSVGQMQITNLPFTVTNAYGPPFMDTAEISQGEGINLTAGYENFWGNFIAGTTIMQVIQGSNAGALQAAFTNANITDAGNFTANGFYTI